MQLILSIVVPRTVTSGHLDTGCPKVGGTSFFCKITLIRHYKKVVINECIIFIICVFTTEHPPLGQNDI